MARIIKKICLITIVLLIAISIKVYANELTLDCPDSINPETENTLEYVLKGNFTGNVNSIKVRYIIPDGVEFQGFTPSEGWNLEQGGTADATGLILRINDTDVTGEVEFGKFTFNVPSTYSWDKISLKLFELDATNTACEIVEFGEDEVEKDVTISKTANNNDDETDDTQNGENNNPSGNNDGENDGQGNNDSNNPSGTNDNGNKNEEDSGNTNALDDNDKNNIGENGYNANSGSASTGAKNDNYNSSQKSITEEDPTVTKTPFGQYGNRSIIMILIVIVSITGFIVYRKLKKVKFIK